MHTLLAYIVVNSLVRCYQKVTDWIILLFSRKSLSHKFPTQTKVMNTIAYCICKNVSRESPNPPQPLGTQKMMETIQRSVLGHEQIYLHQL